MLHLQREPAERPFEALEVGGERRRRVAEIANVLVALVDLELLPVELAAGSESEAAEPEAAGRWRLPCGPTAGVGRKKKRSIAPLGYRLL